MKRLDWTLIRPARAGIKPQRGQRIRREIEKLEHAIDTRVHEATQRLLSEREVDRLAELEERLEDLTVATCEAAHAPRVGDDPDWENRLVDEFAEADTDLELDDYLAARRQDFDCERCPNAAAYSLYPQDPCEISVGPLLAALEGQPLASLIMSPMGPDDMRQTADELEKSLDHGRFMALAEVDVADLLHRAVEYLRFWAKLGFGLRPELVSDEEPLQTPEGPIGAPGAGQSTLLH